MSSSRRSPWLLSLCALVGCSAHATSELSGESPFESTATDRDHVTTGPVCTAYCRTVGAACPVASLVDCARACGAAYETSPRAAACVEQAEAWFRCALTGANACGLVGRPNAPRNACPAEQGAFESCLGASDAGR